MDVMTAVVILSDDEGKGGTVNTMTVIEYDEKNWLVPEWLDYKDAKVTMPARIVCLDLIPHERSPSTDHQFVVSGPVPRSVCEGRCPPQLRKQYLVIEGPDIKFPLPTVH
jgi:hypothetical protein